MNRFTITPEFLEATASDGSYDFFVNVLMVFAQDNKYKLCIDNIGLAYNSYAGIIRRYDCLQVWLKVLNSRINNIEKVSIPNVEYEDTRDLFISIANEVRPYKRLLTCDKSSYNDKQEQIIRNEINLVDGNEAKDFLNEKVSQTIIQNSYGDNSPNINGNNNIIR